MYAYTHTYTDAYTLKHIRFIDISVYTYLSSYECGLWGQHGGKGTRALMNEFSKLIKKIVYRSGMRRCACGVGDEIHRSVRVELLLFASGQRREIRPTRSKSNVFLFRGQQGLTAVCHLGNISSVRVGGEGG